MPRFHGPWSFHITPGDFEQALPKMKEWGGTGIIARIPNERVAKAVIEANLPTVTVGLTREQKRPNNPLANFSEIYPEETEVARLAAEHFLGRQFRNFAFVGMDERAWSPPREQAFCDHIRAAGYSTHVYQQPKKARDREWEQEQAILADWIRDLPTPLALFTCNDDRGRQVLEVCQLADLHVPDDVAVLGVDNDDVFCELSDPPLSSVALNAETAGYRAAELLDGMMRGRIRKPKQIVVETIGVITRRSTEVVAVEDTDVVAALQYIRREQGRDLSVDKVADEVTVSRRSLEKRFQQAIGRTILEEIQLVRLDRAKRLLLETTYPVSKVAEISGFGSTGYFIQFFHTRVGKTPRKYRVDLST